MDINKNKSPYIILIITLALFIVVNLGVYWYMSLSGLNGYDLNGHWAIGAYTLNGYNPYPLIGTDGPIESFNDIPENFSTVPWGCSLGNVFYGGFFSSDTAYVYNLIMHFVFLVLTMIVICKAGKSYLDAKDCSVMVLMLCSHFCFMYSVFFANAGGIICSMLIIAIYLVANHPWMSAIFLSLAMVKPQIAGVVCIIFLLNRKWKTLILAAAIDIAGWIATSLLTDTGFFTLLTQTFSSGTASTEQYLGLFSLLHRFGLPKGIVLGINVVLGSAYSVYLWKYLKDNGIKSENSLILYAPACIASTFWLYKNGTDYFLLTFASVFFAILFLKKAMTLKDKIVTYICIGYLQMSRCAVYLGVTLFGDTPVINDIFKGGDGLLLAVAGIILCRMWIKYDAEKIVCTDK